jgi:hypothetical protein
MYRCCGWNFVVQPFAPQYNITQDYFVCFHLEGFAFFRNFKFPRNFKSVALHF